MKTITCIFFTLMLTSCTTQSTQHPALSQDVQSNEMIVDLNRLTYMVAYEHDQFYSFIGVRALAMTHLAMHDILNSHTPKYAVYKYEAPISDFDPITAAAEATRLLLLDAYPARSDTIDAVCGKWIAKAAGGPQKSAGLEVGAEAAAFFITLRAGDGHEKQGDYTPMTKPGDYRYTPQFDWVWKPDFSVSRPFTLDSLSQFRTPPAPPLSSSEYAAAYNEVKVYGVKDSPARSEDQTHYAHWWAEFGEHGWNRIGRITAKKADLPLIETNRMFALINMNLYDLYLASFDSKYFYDTWRPYTAIRAGDDDGNPLTTGDPDWQPEMLTPPWPEHPSAHAAVGAAGAEIVTHVCGTSKVSFTMESVTAPAGAPERHYDDLDQAAIDCADSRVMNGFHFRFATDAGLLQGRAIAQHTVAHFLTPITDD